MMLDERELYIKWVTVLSHQLEAGPQNLCFWFLQFADESLIKAASEIWSELPSNSKAGASGSPESDGCRL